MYSELFKKTYDMLEFVYSATNSFPRSQRAVLAQRLEVTAIRILELVIDLSENDSVDKRKKIRHEIYKLQILLRVSKDLSYMSFKDYEHACLLMKELADMLDNGGDLSRPTKICMSSYVHSKISILRTGRHAGTSTTSTASWNLNCVSNKTFCSSRTN